MDNIAERHSGTLDGLLAPADEANPVIVAVEIPATVAGLHSCQHTAWMLLNLLARQECIVDAIYIDCPTGVPLAGRIVPLTAREHDLQTALLNGAGAIESVPAYAGTPPSASFNFVIGPGPALETGFRVHGERWWGGIASSCALHGTDPENALPFGPYAAACLAASTVFLGVRSKAPRSVNDAFYSTWSLRAFSAPPTDSQDVGPGSVAGAHIDATLAGAGAVGNTWVHAIWATEDLTGSVIVADADTLGVDRTNLNRCPALGASSVSKRKAPEVAANCRDASVGIQPFDGRVEHLRQRPRFLISAVDTNGSRRAVQALYTDRLLGASTHNLRAEVVRTDPTSHAACISCHNPPETDWSSPAFVDT